MTKVELNTSMLWRLILGLGLLLLAYFVFDILLYLFVAYIIMSAVNPTVNRFARWGLPRWLATLFVFTFILIVIVSFFTISFTPLILETRNFVTALPKLLEKFLTEFNFTGLIRREDLVNYFQDWVSGFSNDLTSVPLSILRVGAGIFNGFLDLITVFVFTFYLVIEKDFVHRTVLLFVANKDKGRIRNLIFKVEEKLGSWLRGQLTLMIVIGTVTFIGLSLIGIPYALPLALIAGFLEIVPIIGPIVSSVPAILVGLSLSPVQALTVVFLYILIQQLENSVIVPRVMKQAVGLDSLVVILALMIGGRLAGPMGALLSVPLTAVFVILYHEWRVETSSE